MSEKLIGEASTKPGIEIGTINDVIIYAPEGADQSQLDGMRQALQLFPEEMPDGCFPATDNGADQYQGSVEQDVIAKPWALHLQ